jgi:hypothetical protein
MRRPGVGEKTGAGKNPGKDFATAGVKTAEFTSLR